MDVKSAGRSAGRFSAPPLAALALLMALTGCSASPKDQAGSRRAKADEYLRTGKFREASIEYQAALQKWPGDADAAFGLARASDALGESALYLKFLEQALRARPGHPGAAVELGSVYWAGARYGDALRLAEAALAGEPGSKSAIALKARSLGALGRTEEARTAWADALRATPGDESAWVAASVLEASTGDWGRARRLLDDGIGKLPNSTLLRVALADLHSRQGEFGAADASLKQAAALAPEDPEIYAALAELDLRRGRAADAKRVLAEAAARLAGRPDAAVRLAVRRADILLALGEADQAEAVLRAARRARPEDVDLAISLARVLVMEGKAKEATTVLPDAPKAGAQERSARLVGALAYLAQGRPGWAVGALQSLIAKGDMGIDAHLIYAKALSQVRRWALARREYEMILGRVPEHFFARVDLASVLMAQEDYEGALRQLDAIPSPLGERASVRVLRAKLLLESGRLTEAGSAIEALLKASPENPVYLTMSGDLQAAKKDEGRALQAYDRAIAVSPSAFGPVEAKANYLQRAGRLRDARKVLEEFMGRDGESVDLLDAIARIYIAEGDFGSAERILGRSLILEPNNWHAKLLRGGILFASGRDAKAVVDFEEAIKMSPSRPDAYNHLAEVHKKRGDVAKAEETYRRLLALWPGEPLTSNNLANLLLEQNRLPEALSAARDAFEGAPMSPFVWDTLGWALELSGKSQEAAPLLERAFRALPGQPDVALHWGTNLLSRRSTEAGTGVLRELVTTSPKSPASAKAAALLARPAPKG